MMRAFAWGIGWALLVVAVTFFWVGFLTNQMNQCGEGKVSIANWGHGVYCVQGEKWKP
jgi:hypothetical protein